MRVANSYLNFVLDHLLTNIIDGPVTYSPVAILFPSREQDLMIDPIYVSLVHHFK